MLNFFNFFKNNGDNIVDDTPKTDENASSAKRNVHNLIILDESGSMISIYEPALTGINETLQTIRNAQKEHTTQAHTVTLVTFNTEHFNCIYNNTPVEMAVDISQRHYRPSGGTPLLDAMGHSINELRHHVAKGDVVLVTIITDGYENASREYNYPAIKALVEELQGQGWVFTYIGANQDEMAVAKSMSIRNCTGFRSNAHDTQQMFLKENNSRKSFFNRLNIIENDEELSNNYFEN